MVIPDLIIDQSGSTVGGNRGASFPSIAPDSPRRSLESQVKTSTHSTLGLTSEGAWVPQSAAVDQKSATGSFMSLACLDIVVHGSSHGVTTCGLCISILGHPTPTGLIGSISNRLPRRSGTPGPYGTTFTPLIASSQRHKKLNVSPSKSVMQQATATDSSI